MPVSASRISRISAIQSTVDPSEIVCIHEGVRVSPSMFGFKTSNLFNAREFSHYVPDGFAISAGLVTDIANARASSEQIEEIGRVFASLKSPVTGRFIVRSSSSAEQLGTSSFAGVFASIRGVVTLDDLICAIGQCRSSGQSETAKQYANLLNLLVPNEHIGVLVQPEVEIKRSALLEVHQDSCFVEHFEGDLIDNIRGKGRPDKSFLVDGDSAMPEDSPDWLRANLPKIVEEVRAWLRSKAHDSSIAILEMIHTGTDTKILQITPGNISTVRNYIHPIESFVTQGTPLAEASKRLGLKAAAMDYFHEKGYFNIPTLIFPPQTTLREITAQFLEKGQSGNSHTLRFSSKAAIGLPRHFFDTVPELENLIGRERDVSWSTIIHPQLNVLRSFELLITSDSYLLEHKPGMWESDSRTHPDVLIDSQSKVRMLRVLDPRCANFIYGTQSREKMIEALSFEKLEKWAEKIKPIVDDLREDFRNALPLNFHFVEDFEGHWQFLNIRSGFPFALAPMSAIQPHIVESLSDLKAWNGMSPIRLRISIERGSEAELFELATHLPKTPIQPLIVDFGLLSHPAIVLRELGFSLYPSYLLDDRVDSRGVYEEKIARTDQGLDPIDRIKLEDALYADQIVRVVVDREPITSGHLLIVAEKRARSFADLVSDSDLQNFFQLSLPALVGTEEWIFIERGRARFCTSGLTEKHAHAHLLPAYRFTDGSIQEFVGKIGATAQPSLADALRSARNLSGEYILVVTRSGLIYLRSYPADYLPEKRFIRSFFTSQLV